MSMAPLAYPAPDATTAQLDEGKPARSSDTVVRIFLLATIVGLCVLFLLFAFLRIRTFEAVALSMPSRVEQLNRTVPATVFQKWCDEHRGEQPNTTYATFDDVVCVICLESIQAQDSVRALSCKHFYHTQCFDRWFQGWHDSCPLCLTVVLPVGKHGNV
ncbi:hypothetical protein K458DRAFT_343264 [Lentithecium fluviatile CBS 122367]|uniref:RING-type domain-containing protein n=1 Tax=Lentithecium fluviatile CBS 122367 TaxID=1168545 RepID=A0A6G1ITU6_9PLEO|nr:hypothetical protein K458DRAFT_343264 [Lentithecium fluviatile CBS 122367]